MLFLFRFFCFFFRFFFVGGGGGGGGGGQCAHTLPHPRLPTPTWFIGISFK